MPCRWLNLMPLVCMSGCLAPISPPVATPAPDGSPPPPPLASWGLRPDETPEKGEDSPLLPSLERHGEEKVRAGHFAHLIPFTSRRRVGVGGEGTDLNIFVYDRSHRTVLTLPGVNTEANEFFPSFSHNGHYLVYSTDAPGDVDIYRYDVANQLIDTLPTLNSSGNALRAAISDDGDTIAYSEALDGRTAPFLYDLKSRAKLALAPFKGPVEDVLVRDISPDGRTVALSMRRGDHLDIELYAIGSGTILTPPFLNSPANELTPRFGPDGRTLVFQSDRHGDFDIFKVDLVRGWLDRLPLLNSPAQDVDPFYLGDEILFTSDRSGAPRIYLYNQRKHWIDTLPITDIGLSEEF